MKKLSIIAALSTGLFAHHGVPTVSVAGLVGPGAPIETTSSTTLQEGSLLGYMRVDSASYTTYTPAKDGEQQRSDFFLYGAGYGVTSYFSAYIFAPYYTKAQDDALTTSDFHDLNFQLTLGMKYDDGLILMPKSESLDDLEDWHFTATFSFTLPTGNSNLTDANGVLLRCWYANKLW
ncbi:MAG: hypothetical protein Q9M40_11025 [Sulfurimonas sp.]|nr:hypothetical protein [Sulfurimonas sp.]